MGIIIDIIILSIILYWIYRVTKKEKVSNSEFTVQSFVHAAICMEHIENFYDFEKKIEKYNQTREELLKLPDLEISIKRGIKFYNKQRKAGIYSTRMATMNKDASIVKEHPEIINFRPYLIQAIENFEPYWDNVLAQYKLKRYYIKRINYLIDYTQELKSKWYLKDDDEILDQIIRLNDKYVDLLRKSTDK